jgi:hypothetical protein
VLKKAFCGLNNCNVALLAFDGGARAAIMPLAAYAGFDPMGINSSEEKERQKVLLSGRYQGLVVGTSDSSAGKRIESQVVGLANGAGIPVVAIEDYPGNYYPTDGARADVVVVDSDFGRSLVLGRQLASPPHIWVCKPVRYDALRQRSPRLRDHVSEHWRTDSTRWVLWAGQPETEDGLETMKRFLPVLSGARDVKLLFKAHPRDGGYLTGAYRDLLAHADIDYLDVTAHELDAVMEYAPRIVLTQFSSVGVEAGFYGIPTANILYPDVGGKRLFGKKGYNIPPWAQQGAAFVVTTTAAQEVILDTALNDEAARASAIKQFDAYFSISDLAGPALAARIRRYCAEWTNARPKNPV